MSSPLLRGLALGTQIALSMVIPLIVFALAGRWLDRRFETFPLFFLGGFILALIIGLVLAIRAVRGITEPPSSR